MQTIAVWTLMLVAALALSSCGDDDSDGQSAPDVGPGDATDEGDTSASPDGGPGDTSPDASGDPRDDAEVVEDEPDARVPRICADTATTPMLPSPAWEAGTSWLTAPAGDQAVAMLDQERPSWVSAIEGNLDGWPAWTPILLPLEGTATGVSAEGIRYYGELPDGWIELATEAVPELLGTDFVWIRPRDPLPPGFRNVIIAIDDSAITGASPLPACGADGQPDPAHAVALESLPAGDTATFALHYRLSTAARNLPDLYPTLEANPVLTVSSAHAIVLADLGEHAPSAETATALAETGVQGILSLPAYQDSDGVMHVDESGTLVPQGTTEPGFVVVLPSQGTPPYPFVLFQHGGGQNKLDVVQLAGPLASEGFAMVAIDLPAHGDRAEREGGGTDLDIFHFDAPILTRDNLRQGAADHLAVLTGVAQLNATIESTLGVADALDPQRRFYMGLSLGAVTGTFTVSSADLMGGALFVAGGGYSDILRTGLFSMMVMDVLQGSDVEVAARLTLVDLLLEGADPLSYPPVESRQTPPKPLLFFQATQDPVIDELANDRWARGFGAALALPRQHSVPLMNELELPAADNFAWPGGTEHATRILIQAPMTEVPITERHGGLIVQPYSQQLVAHCFATILETGSCEVIDTGFSEH